MSIYYDGEKTHRYPFLEVKVKDQSGNEEDLKDPDDEAPEDDYSTEEPETNTQRNSTEEPTPEDNEGVNDYSADEGDEPEDYSDTNNNPTDEPNTTDDNEPEDYSVRPDNEDDVPVGDGSDEPTIDIESEPIEGENELENIEKELFSTLTPEQIEIKHRELKKQYLTLYDSTGHIVDRINNSPKSSKTFDVVNFVIDQVSKLRSYLLDYLVDNYPNHTYFENLLNYNQYLGIMSGINQLLDQLPAENE